MTLEDQLKEVTAQVAATQAKLGSLSKIQPERERLKAELADLLARLAAKKSEIKDSNMKRSFSGLQSPLFEVIAERFPSDVVRELESDALARQAAREEAASARRRAKKAAAPPAPLPPSPKPEQHERRRPAQVEVIHRRPHGGSP
jgi:hypothetical protein